MKPALNIRHVKAEHKPEEPLSSRNYCFPEWILQKVLNLEMSAHCGEIYDPASVC